MRVFLAGPSREMERVKGERSAVSFRGVAPCGTRMSGAFLSGLIASTEGRC